MSKTEIEYWGEAKLRYLVEQLMIKNGVSNEGYRLLGVNGQVLLGLVPADATPTSTIHIFKLRHATSNETVDILVN